MSRNLRVFIGAAIIFYLIAAMNEATALYVLAGIALAAIAGCYWLSRLAVAGLSLTVRLPRAEVQANSDVPVRLTLDNIGVISRPGPLVKLDITNLSIPGVAQCQELGLPPLPAGASVTAATDIHLPSRGRWQIGPAHIIGTDPLGMFQRQGPASSSVPLLVLPEMFEVPWMWRHDLLSPAARLAARARTRHGGEFWGIRQHEPGDDLRHVHWKVTAHRGEMVVKEYARGRELTASVWLDLNVANLVGEGSTSSLELSITMAASLIPALLRMDQAVSLVGSGLPVSLASAGRGDATAYRALRALAEVQASVGRPFAALIAEQAREARPGLTALVICSGVEPGLDHALLQAAARGLSLRCLLLAPATALTPDQRARQDALAHALQRAGIPVAVGSDRGDLPQALGRLSESTMGGAPARQAVAP